MRGSKCLQRRQQQHPTNPASDINGPANLALLLPPPRPSCLQYRWHVFKSIRAAIDQNEGGLEKFTQGQCGAGLSLSLPCSHCCAVWGSTYSSRSRAAWRRRLGVDVWLRP